MKSTSVLVALTGFLAASAALSVAAPALADNRVFIIANQSDGYGIDECLANGQTCGTHAARAYCRSREFTEATAFRRVDPDEVTGAIPASTGSHRRGSRGAEFIAITCHR
jgi:hypothetical protein